VIFGPVICGRRLRRRSRPSRTMHVNHQGRSAQLRKGRVSEDYSCYSVTKTVFQRRKALASTAAAKVLTDSWQHLRAHDRIKLFAFCIMPDHFHMALCLMPGEDLSKVFEDSNKFTARELNRLLGRSGQFWQEGFHDRRCRDENELHDLCLYIEHNPVRARLVTSAELWPYSSAFPPNNCLLDREWWP
jgi:putative transposase